MDIQDIYTLMRSLREEWARKLGKLKIPKELEKKIIKILGPLPK